MALSLRTLFFSVPALIVLIGGYFVSPKDSTPDEASLPGSTSVLPSEWPSEKDENLIHRVAVKEEATLDLLDGRMTLEETVDRFRVISAMNPQDAEKTGQDARFVHQVISFVRAHAARNPRRYQATCTKLESSSQALLHSLEHPGLH